MARYALKTRVEVETTRRDIEHTLTKYGVMPDGKAFGEHARPAMAAALKNGVAPTLDVGRPTLMPDQYQREYYLRRKREVAYVSVQLSHDELAELDAAAKRDGVTRSEKIREFITWGLLDNG